MSFSKINLNEEESKFQNLVKLNPNNPEYNYRVSKIFLKNLKIRKAELAIRKAISLDKNNFKYHSTLGKILIKKKNLKYTSNIFEESLIIMAAKKTTFFAEKKQIDSIAFGSSHGEYLFNPTYFKGAFNMCSRSQDLKYSYYLYKKLSPYIKNVIVFYSIFSSGFYLEKSNEKEISLAMNEVFRLGIKYKNPEMLKIHDIINNKFHDLSLPYSKNGFLPKEFFFPESYGLEKRINDHLKFNRISTSNKYLTNIIDLSRTLKHKLIIVIPPVRSDFKSAIGIDSKILFYSLNRILKKNNIKLLNFWDNSSINDEDFGDYDHLFSMSQSSCLISNSIRKFFIP